MDPVRVSDLTRAEYFVWDEYYYCKFKLQVALATKENYSTPRACVDANAKSMQSLGGIVV